MNKKTAMRLCVGAYGAVGILLLLCSLFAFLQDSLHYATGELKYAQYNLSEFTAHDIEIKSADEFVTTGADSQLIIANYNAPATALRLDMKCSKFPGEVTMYYTRGNEEFSTDKRIFGVMQSDGSYTFSLPRGHIHSLRIDPTCFTGVKVKVNRIDINNKRSFWSYFAYSGEVLFNYIVITGLCISMLAWLISSVLPILKCKFRLNKKKV